MNPTRLQKMLEAARATALARELVERWTFEARQLAKALEDKDDSAIVAIRTLRDELLAESNVLTDRAATIYAELRANPT